MQCPYCRSNNIEIIGSLKDNKLGLKLSPNADAAKPFIDNICDKYKYSEYRDCKYVCLDCGMGFNDNDQ